MKELRLIIAGSRDWNDYTTLKNIANEVLVDVFYKHPYNKVYIISGTAQGADTLGEQYASEYNFEVKRFPADWNKHGKKAGVLRNIEMAKNADACVVFWDGKSKGTKHMIDIAQQHNLFLYVVEKEKVFEEAISD